MDKTKKVIEENKWSVRRDIILGLLVAVCIIVGLMGVAKVSLDGNQSAIKDYHLQPLKEVTEYIIETEYRFSLRDGETVIIIDEDDTYEGWGKAAVRTIIVNNYFKDDIGQITIEALWNEEAAENRCRYIQEHPKRRWFKPWIDDKEYNLKSAYFFGRFCVRFTPEVNDEDERAVMDKIGTIVKKGI